MTEITSLQAQIDDLSAHYQAYIDRCAEYVRQHSSLEHVGDWIMGNNRFSKDTMHDTFLNGLKEKVAQLDQALSAEEPAIAQEYAQKALAIIVDPIEEKKRDTCGWMRFAAEVESQPLLVYLDYEALADFYTRYITFYPKRYQFPNQVKYRKAMEKLLKEKRPGK